MKKFFSYITEISYKTKERFWRFVLWSFLVYLFITNFNIHSKFTVLITTFLSVILWYVIKGIITYSGSPSDHIKYRILCRAIAATQEKTNFIMGIEKWENQENFDPFEKGIDPSDVLSAIEEANKVGIEDFRNEKRKYGYINQL